LELVAEGFTAEIFKWAEGQVLKLYRPPFAAVAERECAVMQLLVGSGLRIPRVIKAVNVDGRTGYVMEEICGPSLRDLLEAQQPAQERLAATLARLHAVVHSQRVNHDRLGTVADRVALRVLESQALGELRSPVAAVLAGMTEGGRLCHNDFHFGSVLQDAGGLWIIDRNGAGPGDVHADVGKTTVLMAHAPVGLCFGPRAHRSRSELIGIYLEAYRAERELDGDVLRKWQIVRAAELISLRVPFAGKLTEFIKSQL